MSAFLVEPRTIHIVAKAVNDHRPDEKKEKLEILSDALFHMNRQALIARYGREEWLEYQEPYLQKHPTAYDYKDPGKVSPVETYKLLNCYLYQCSEGNVPLAPLFQEVEQVKNDMAHEIASTLPGHEDQTGYTVDYADDLIRALPEWDSLPWG